MRLRIDEALKRAKACGRVVLKKDLAEALWPEADEASRAVYMSRLCTGKTKNVKPEQIRIICLVTGVSADFLLGM